MSLVPHLRDDLAVFGLLREHPRFFDRPAQRLLHVDVLAAVHRRQRNRRVHVIGRRHDHRVDVFLLVEHVPVVPVLPELGHLLLDEPAQIVHVVGPRPLLVRRDLRRRRLMSAFGRVLLSRWRIRRRRRIQRRLETRQCPVEQRPIHVADGNDVLAEERTGIAEAHAADPDCGNVHRVARRLEPPSEHVPRHDDQPGACRGRRGDKLPSRHARPLDPVALYRLSLTHGFPRFLNTAPSF